MRKIEKLNTDPVKEAFSIPIIIISIFYLPTASFGMIFLYLAVNKCETDNDE